MAIAILIGAAFFGVTLLILVFAYQSIEDQRARERENEAAAAVPPGVPRAGFFGPDRPASATRALASYPHLDALVVEIDRFLRGEQLLAERFLSHPSAVNLHTNTQRAWWNSASPERARGKSTGDLDLVVDQVEQRFRRERRIAERFLDEPSLVNLHHRPAAQASLN